MHSASGKAPTAAGEVLMVSYAWTKTEMASCDAVAQCCIVVETNEARIFRYSFVQRERIISVFPTNSEMIGISMFYIVDDR